MDFMLCLYVYVYIYIFFIYIYIYTHTYSPIIFGHISLKNNVSPWFFLSFWDDPIVSPAVRFRGLKPLGLPSQDLRRSAEAKK